LISVPPEGAQAVLVALAGNRENLVAVALEERGTRPRDYAPGTSGLYSSSGANRWLLLPDGTIEGQGAISHDGDLDVTGGVTITGDVSITGAVTITGSLVVNGIDFSTHVHGGVQAGAGTTAVPQ